MNTLITSYGINFQAFQLTLGTIQGIVAGSAALSAYLTQEGIDPGFQPNDIDIFVPGVLEHVRDARGHTMAGQYIIKSLKTMKDFLESYGFTESNKFNNTDSDKYYSTISKIQKVTSFTNKNNKEIQVIVINTYNLIEHISKDFDLSACISWYDVRNNCFKTMDPHTTKQKEMYFVSDTDNLAYEKSKSRIQKYIARGFKLIEKPCPFIETPDLRDMLSDKKFDDVQVMDIITLDEMPLKDYLQMSAWNIVLKAGETFYAFERTSLMEYMNKKCTTINNLGQVYETPFNQCITLDAYNQLGYSDYSIYELKSAYSVPIYGGKVKSLFHLNCYSIREWVDGHQGGIVEIPPKHLVMSQPTVRRIIQRGEPLPPQVGARAYLARDSLQEVLNVSLDDILSAHAHLSVPGNLEAFHAAFREIRGEI
jgi:hypothetical protein